MKKFRIVAVGGTFDELHRGHEALLLKAFEAGDHVLIGLCTDRLVRKMKKDHIIAPYIDRLKALKTFLQEKGILNRVRIVTLDDSCGPASTDGKIEALVVSEETEYTGLEINRKRLKAGLHPLEIVVVNMVSGENGLPISTTRIREGEIDREGRLLKRCQ